MLDLLLDVNSCPRIPSDKRIDLDLDAAYPDLFMKEELSRVADFKSPGCSEIYRQMKDILDEKDKEKAASERPKTHDPAVKSTLKDLVFTTPHISLNNDRIHSLQAQDLVDLKSSLEPLEGYSAPMSYLTLDQIDEYLNDIDTSLGTARHPSIQIPDSTLHDLSLRNPHSVYNWLRRNEPKVFLQDGESEGKEKPPSKSSAARGTATKRASLPVPSRPDALEFVAEDGLGYDVSLGGPGTGPSSIGGKGKRKREEDDGYTPKGVKPEAKAKKAKANSKRKKDEVTTTATPPPKKGKGKKNSSSPDDLPKDSFVNTLSEH